MLVAILVLLTLASLAALYVRRRYPGFWATVQPPCGYDGYKPLPGTAQELLAPESSFYMNFQILNSGEAFPKIMRKKLRSYGKYVGHLAYHASGLLTMQSKFGKLFSNKVGDQLVKLLPVKLEAKGINFKLTKVHCGKMDFVTLRAEVVEIDLVKLLESSKGTEFAHKLAPVIGVARLLADVDRSLIPRVQRLIMTKLEHDVPPLMEAEGGLKLLMVNKPTAEQADFFFDALSTHKFEIVLSVLNASEAAPNIANEKSHNPVRALFGRRVGKAVLGAMSSTTPKVVREKLYGMVLARTLTEMVPAQMAEVGVNLSVIEQFVSAKLHGSMILRCEIDAVNLDVFRSSASNNGECFSGMVEDQVFLKLGHKGRSDVYTAVRNYISSQLPQACLATKGLRVQVTVRDVQNIPADMKDVDCSSESDDGDPEVPH